MVRQDTGAVRQKWLKIYNYDGVEMSLVREIRDMYTGLAVSIQQTIISLERPWNEGLSAEVSPEE